jgi:hypothetical protein
MAHGLGPWNIGIYPIEIAILEIVENVEPSRKSIF